MKTSILYFFTLLFLGQVYAQDWTPSNKAVASFRHSLDDFGTVVAIDGNNAIVGDPGHSYDASNENGIQKTGAAYIFKKGNDGNWALVQKLVSPNRVQNQGFGKSVDISGGLAVVGVPNETTDENGNNPLPSAGAVFHYRQLPSGQWELEQKIVASDRAAGDNFGASVSIDLTNLVVGAVGIDPTTQPADQDAGGFYYFKRNASFEWIEQEVVYPDIPFGGDQLGARIALDGNHLVISSLQADGQVQNVGVAYIFELASGQWEEAAYIFTPQDEETNDFFGRTIAISGDYALIGSSSLGSSAGGNGFQADVGAVHVYQRAANGTWNHMQELTAPTPITDGEFGASASIDETTIVIGAPYQDASNKGIVYIYELDNGTWNETQSITGEVASDNLGESVAIWRENMILSAPGQDTDADGMNGISDAGAVYFYTSESCTPADLPNISASDDAICGAGSVTLSINTGELNDATEWVWYKASCGADEVDTGEEVTIPLNSTTTYYVRGENGCDPGDCGSITIDIYPVPSPSIVLKDSKTLSLKGDFNSYQWAICDGRKLTPIKDAESKDFAPEKAGEYNVIVQNFYRCEGQAQDCFSFLVTSTNNAYFSEAVELYPNPSSSGMVNVSLGSSYGDVTYHLYTSMGKLISSENVGSAEAFQVPLPAEQGIYLLDVHTGSGNTTTLKITHQ